MWTENDEEEEASSCSGAKVSEMVVLLFLKGLSSNVMGDMLLYCYCFPVFSLPLTPPPTGTSEDWALAEVECESRLWGG